MIRLAMKHDLPRIMDIVKNSVKVMNDGGNYQWDQSYPLESNYQEDLDRNELYVYENKGVVKGVTAISKKEHSEYPQIKWSSSDFALTIKRLAVDPKCRGGEIADLLFKHAEKIAEEKGIPYLKTDTFAKNKSAQKLFDRNGYQFVEKNYVEEKDDSLLYFEKLL